MPEQNPVVVLLKSGNEELAARCQAISPRVQVITRKELESDPGLLAKVEVVYGRLDSAQWSEASRLKWLQTMGAGVDSVLTPQICSSQVVITNASGIHAAPITEHMFGLLLAYTRRLFAARQLQAQQKWDGHSLGDNLPLLEGKTLGLLGLGAIGSQSARIGRSFGMRVLGFRRSPQPHPEVDGLYYPPRLLEFLSQCDVVMNTLPLTPETRGLIGQKELEAMREGAILINTGRGATISTDALVEALQKGRPAAVLLDVTDPEPLPEGHSLWSMENVVITPHYSGAHANYDERAGAIFLDNLARYLRGDPLVNVVDKQAGY